MNLEGKVLNQTDSIYHHLILDAIDNGAIKGDRTNTGTRALVGRLARFDLMNGRNPRVTTKFVNENPEKELKWFMNGSSSIKELRDQKIGIWNSWLMPGSAVYRPMTENEMMKAIERELCKRDDIDTVDFHLFPEYVQAEDGATTFSTEHQVLNRNLLVHYAGPESLEGYYISIFDRRPVFLEDGDIGKGGYGPQWRSWEDTQLVLLSNEEEIKAYYAQGYIMLGEMDHCLDNQTYAVMHRKIDQLANAVNLLRTNPDSRRIIVSAWNPALTWKAALPPCHLYFQFVSHELTVMQRVKIFNDRTAMLQREHEIKQDPSLVSWATLNEESFQQAVNDGNEEQLHVELDRHGVKRRGLFGFVLLRSNDLGLGWPFNVAQYATLTHLMAHVTDHEPMELIWTAVDAHVYSNHIDALKKQLERESMEGVPRIKLAKHIKEIDDFKVSDIEIVDYNYHPALTSEMPPAI